MLPREVAVAGHIDGQLVGLFGIQVKGIKKAAVFENDAVRPKARPIYVKIREVGELANFVTLHAVAKEVEPVLGAAVRIEVNRIAVPHRKSVGPVLVRHLFDFVRLQVVNPDVLRHAALIALPGAEIAKDAVVGDAAPVGRKRRETAFIERQGFGQAAIEADRVEPTEPGVKSVTAGKIQDVVGIREPVDDFVVDAHALGEASAAGVDRKLLRVAAFGGDDINVKIAVVLSRECNPFAVGRELREKFQARMRCDAPRHPARARHQPQVAGVAENNLVFGNVGEPHQAPLRHFRGSKACGPRDER